MEVLDELFGRYRNHPHIQAIDEALKSETPLRIELDGLVGAQEAFVLAGLYQLNPKHTLYVAKDKEEAAYLQNSLANIMANKTIHFFPDSFKFPTSFDEVNSNNILLRTETINRLTSQNAGGQVVVTYPEALFEKVVSPEVLKENRIEIAKDEKIDLDFLIEILIEYGFQRVDFVYEPGQFSIRGGIVDIFSFGNEWPYRVELFDEDVESIRTFNPTNQLSVRNISKVSIVPNVENTIAAVDKVSVFKVLDPNTVVVIKDFQFFIDRMQSCFEKAEDFLSNLLTNEVENVSKIIKDRSFIFPRDVVSDISDRHILLLENSSNTIFEINQQYSFDSKPQPSFNKNFKLLIEDLNENSKRGIHNLIFTESKRQIERFYSIFEDLEANVEWQPVNIAIHQGFIDETLNVACYTDHQIFERFHKYRLKKGFTKDQALNLKMLRELIPGDFVTHIDHGVGKYSGLEKLNINGRIQESVRLIYQNNDLLYVGINSLHKISKYIGKEGTAPKLSKIGSESWKNLKRKTKKKVKDIAKELIKLYAQRKAAKGHAFPPDGYLQNELEASFIYEDTPDQLTATQDVKEDMEKATPMDRLICGDVGFGKTEVAMRAAFKAITDGKQVAILVPTTILALQHYNTFRERLDAFGAEVDYINRFRSTKQKNEIFEKLKSGQIDLVIGTHGLLNKKVGFKDLGLLIIDEEQKFGVASKEKLRSLKVNVDTLTLTATPIPRTLQFSLMAARDLSIIRTPPPNRQPIHTERRIFNEELIKDAVYYETSRAGQVFFVHNRVKSLIDIAAMLKRMCPDLDIAMAHGQMDPKKLEETLVSFIGGKYDVLVCTNIIETGLDIPNANTIIINNAHQFGLSDLHQLRGRVGRSNRKAYCYLFSPPLSVLTVEARKRIKTLEEFSDLGSGFNIAMRDLDIRGAGNLLGGEQSGFIADIGFETYQKILDEAIQELKETEFKDLFKKDLEKKRAFVRDVDIDTDIEMHIPSEYISNINERLSLYTKLNELKSDQEVQEYKVKMKDRFGPIPKTVENLFKIIKLRWLCKSMGFERFIFKNNKLRCYFVHNAQSPYFESDLFHNILALISTRGSEVQISLKKSHKYLFIVREHVKSLDECFGVLRFISEELDASVSVAEEV